MSKIGRSLGDVSAGEARPVHVDMPALAYLEVLHTDANAIDDMLEFATKLQYREESHWGKMLVRGYKGMSEPEARDKMKGELHEAGERVQRSTCWRTAPVYCRCGDEVVVKVGGGPVVPKLRRRRMEEAGEGGVRRDGHTPEKSRNAFEAAVEWINLSAVARAQGLGTKFPLDRNFIIESLSDSTIYPAFYTISNLIANVDTEA